MASPIAMTALVPLLLVTDGSMLRHLDQGGLSLGAHLGLPAAVALRDLAAHPGLGQVFATLTADVDEAKRADKRSGVGMAFSHRLFDARWFRSPDVRLELVGVVNRLDRAPFGRGRCGETRLIYRLAYAKRVRGQAVASRLPMTLSLVYGQGGDGETCQQVATRWRGPANEAKWLLDAKGPLAQSRLETRDLLAVEVNLQRARWPSTVRPELGGHAEYVLRVFRPGPDGAWQPAPLENTPDVDKLQQDAKLRAELRAWLGSPAELQRIDQGIAMLPERFLATRALSVAPRGLARLANRPFAQLFPPPSLHGIDLAATRLGTPTGLVRRLDGLTCAGCHESRSVAGFHVLGEDPVSMRADALAAAISPHLAEDLPRRAAFATAVANGTAPAHARSPAERPGVVEGQPAGGYGAHCGLGDAAFAAWTCDAGLTCRAIDDPDVGQCLPTTVGIGDACQPGLVRASVDPHQDGVTSREIACKGGGYCETSRVGFPGGMCANHCTAAALREPGARCGAIPSLVAFNRCLALRLPFADCVANNARPAAVRGCSDTQACRDDYVCARTGGREGVCMPPYFLFQLRVDGHP